MEGFFNHLNPSVIRRVMLNMNAKELAECEAFIYRQALILAAGPKRDMYVRLFIWCKSIKGKG